MAKTTDSKVIVELSPRDRALLRRIADALEVSGVQDFVEPEAGEVRRLVEDKPEPWRIPEGAGLGYEAQRDFNDAAERRAVVSSDNDGTWTVEVNASVAEKIVKNYDPIAELSQPREIRRNFTEFPDEDRG